MRHPYRKPRYRHTPLRIGRRFPRFRGGRLLGMVGLAALGFTLLDKHQRETQRRAAYAPVEVEPEDWQGG